VKRLGMALLSTGALTALAVACGGLWPLVAAGTVMAWLLYGWLR
jgi:hypothetical protein